MSDGVQSDAVLEAMPDRANRYWWTARRRYLKLSPEQRATVVAGFERHRRACRKSGLEPDPFWIIEAVDEQMRIEK
jgi:hypothetical protein